MRAPTYKLPTDAPTHSPWGGIQNLYKLGDGVYSAATASHGGIFVAASLLHHIPKPFLQTAYNYPWHSPEGHWFEEDCGWSIPVCFIDNISTPSEQDIALNTLFTMYPNECRAVGLDRDNFRLPKCSFQFANRQDLLHA